MLNVVKSSVLILLCTVSFTSKHIVTHPQSISVSVLSASNYGFLRFLGFSWSSIVSLPI